MVLFATVERNGNLVARDENGGRQSRPEPEHLTLPYPNPYLDLEEDEEDQQSETQQTQHHHAPPVEEESGGDSRPQQPSRTQEANGYQSELQQQQQQQKAPQDAPAPSHQQQESAHQPPQKKRSNEQIVDATTKYKNNFNLNHGQQAKKKRPNIGSSIPIPGGDATITTNKKNNYNRNHGKAVKKKEATAVMIDHHHDNNRLEFNFDVDIPSYYRSNKNTADDNAASGENEVVVVDAVARSEADKMTGSAIEAIEESILIGQANGLQHGRPKSGDEQLTSKRDDVGKGGLPSEHFPTEQSEIAGTQPKNNEDGKHDNNNQSTKHNDFITALEKHGSSVGAWESMASDLNWTIEEVQVYAYSYFKSIVRYGNTKGNNNHNKLNDCNTQQDNAWSFQEYILLDSLMLKYCTDLSCLKNANIKQKDNRMSSEDAKQSTVWEKIACQLPGKTVDVCRKVGTSRLLKIYRESKEEAGREGEVMGIMETGDIS